MLGLGRLGRVDGGVGGVGWRWRWRWRGRGGDNELGFCNNIISYHTISSLVLYKDPFPLHPTPPSLPPTFHQRIHQPHNLLLAHDPLAQRPNQPLPIDARVRRLARVEHGARFRRVPGEGCEGGVGVAEDGLPEHFGAVVWMAIVR